MPTIMADTNDDVWASMNLPMAFGKQNVKKKIDVEARLEKTRRVDPVSPIVMFKRMLRTDLLLSTGSLIIFFYRRRRRSLLLCLVTTRARDA